MMQIELTYFPSTECCRATAVCASAADAWRVSQDGSILAWHRLIRTESMYLPTLPSQYCSENAVIVRFSRSAENGHPRRALRQFKNVQLSQQTTQSGRHVNVVLVAL